MTCDPDSGPAAPVTKPAALWCPAGQFALRDFPAEPERKARRPNTAPAYYLGHPAGLWITAMRPRRRPIVAATQATGARCVNQPVTASGPMSTPASAGLNP
jgi:hypothetical protein